MHRAVWLASLLLICAQSPETRAAAVENPYAASEPRGSGQRAEAPVQDGQRDIKGPLVVPDSLKLTTYLSAKKTQRSRSVGAPNKGRLRNGVMLAESGPGWIRRDRDAAYGTDETIALIHYLGARLFAAYPGTAPLVIGDISKKGGGRLSPHRSHRTGRDVDIAFPETGNVTRRYFNGQLRVEDIDYDKAWFLLESLILTRKVQYIFANEAILPHLMKAARRAGWAEPELNRLIMDSAGKQRLGLIRSAAGHIAHFHVRFICPKGHTRCEP